MREAQKPDHVSLNSLIARLKEGRYLVPDFQREFEWKARDIRDLMRSIFLDYYIGSLLLWKGTSSHYASLSCEPLYGQKQGHPEYIVLDGQQRLTAIHYAFVAPDIKLQTRANRALYYVRVDRFMAEEYEEAFDFSFVNAGGGNGTTGANKFHGPMEKQWQNHIFPLAVVGAEGWDLPNWVQGYAAYWQDQVDLSETDAERDQAKLHAENAVLFGEHLKSITGTFQISYIELDKELPIDKVCDIFTQINSKGVRLDVFDLLNALLKPKDVQLKALWRKAAPKLEFIESKKLNVYILQVMSILRQTYCSPKHLYYLVPGVERKTRNPDGTFEHHVMVPSSEEFEKRWHAAVKALEDAIARLRHPHEFGVSKSTYLPYFAILPIFAAALAEVKAQPPENRLVAEQRFRLWYWASIFTNQYSASSETTAARDIQNLREWFVDETAEPAPVKQFRAMVSHLDLRTERRKGEARYNAIFNLLVIAGARDWISGAIPHPDELDDHHIVPRSWGQKHLEGNAADTILNRTPLTDETNRNVICDRLPNQYLPDLIESNGRPAVEALMQSHFVSPEALDILLRDPFTPADFEEFLRDRQRVISAAVQSLLIGGRADLSPDLRRLDEEIERVELDLRKLVTVRLENDLALVPTHIRPKLDDRITRMLKKNPGVDAEAYKVLSSALEFADLTELLGIMQGSSTSSRFTDIFPHKEGLIAKFNQLGELRNSIRHSRTVNEVTRLEGEAAVHWFDASLKKALSPAH